MMITKPKVFIIESLDFKDEKADLFEGKVLSKILKFAQIESEYYYVRTRVEFEYVIDIFKKSKFRYLHISCHGNDDSICTTFDPISFNDLSKILEDAICRKRLFLSACSVTNKHLANKLLSRTNCYSIVGPAKDIFMDDAVIFWASFYQLIFKIDPDKMNRHNMKSTLIKLVETFEFPIKYFASSTKAAKGWTEVML